MAFHALRTGLQSALHMAVMWLRPALSLWGFLCIAHCRLTQKQQSKPHQHNTESVFFPPWGLEEIAIADMKRLQPSMDGSTETGSSRRHICGKKTLVLLLLLVVLHFYCVQSSVSWTASGKTKRKNKKEKENDDKGILLLIIKKENAQLLCHQLSSNCTGIHACNPTTTTTIMPI